VPSPSRIPTDGRFITAATQRRNMYAVVGCGDCEALWIVETGAESSQCPRCGITRPLEKRAKLATVEDEDRARDLRTSLLAERRGVEDAASFSDLEGDVEAAGPDDEQYLSASGLDADAVAAAGVRAEGGVGGATGASHREIVEAAIDALAEPTAAAVVAYATERGVSEDATRSLLERLVRAGEAIERDGVYRRL
jgi:hypothetical protein